MSNSHYFIRELVKLTIYKLIRSANLNDQVGISNDAHSTLATSPVLAFA